MRVLPLLIGILAPTVMGGAALAAAPASSTEDLNRFCPSHGHMLPETFPAQVITLSDFTEGYEAMRDMVYATLKAQPTPTPHFYINADPEAKQSAFDRLIADLKKDSQTEFGGRGEFYATHVHLLAAEMDMSENANEKSMAPYSDQWQQDYMKPMFDPKTGGPVAAFTPNNGLAGTLPQTLSAALEKDLKIKSVYPMPNLDDGDATSGGNIDMLPGQICVVGGGHLGEKDWNAYADAMCGSHVKKIKAPEAWVRSMHVDEILRVVPNFKAKGCGYTALIASPRRARSVLAAHPDDAAFTRPRGFDVADLDANISRVSGMAHLCAIYQNSKAPPPMQADFTKNDFDTWKSETYLEFAQSPDWSFMAEHPCDKMTNADVIHALDVVPLYRTYIPLTQSVLDRFKEEVVTAMQKALPNCQIDAAEVPDVFLGKLKQESPGHYSLADGFKNSGYSVYPNPTNSTLIGRTLLVPNPLNNAIKADLTQILTARGIKAVYIDTMKMHENSGNVHCSMQVMRSCEPQTLREHKRQ